MHNESEMVPWHSSSLVGAKPEACFFLLKREIRGCQKGVRDMLAGNRDFHCE